MLSITDPGIPNGLTGNLAALMQTLVDKPMQERQMALKEKHENNADSERSGTLAENIRYHNMLGTYHDGLVDNGQDRVGVATTNANERNRHNVATEGMAATNATEKGRHNAVTESQAGENEDDRNARADDANVRAMHDAWLNSVAGMVSTPEEQADHYHGLLEATAKRRAAKSAIPGKPAPTAQPAIDTTAPAQTPAPAAAPMPGAPAPAAPLGQAPSPAPTTQQVQLLHKAAQWNSLPSLSDSDKQKVQQAIQTKNFKALAAMDAKMGGAAVGPYAR